MRVGGEIMLFGVRVVVDSMRKSVSMNNLSQYQHTTAPSPSSNKNDAAGYASADDAVPNNSARHRKRGIPWSEEEHKLFLVGLQKVGKGDWRGISRNYVKTRTPTQVASHAQKYFLRRTNLNRRRRRSSLFDITTDSVTVSAITMEEEQIQQQENVHHSHYPVSPATQAESNNLNMFPVRPAYPTGLSSGAISVQAENPMEKLTFGRGKMEQNEPTEIAFTIPVVADPRASMVADTGSGSGSGSSSSVDPPALSLGLSLSSSRHSNLHSMPCFKSGDSIISVA